MIKSNGIYFTLKIQERKVKGVTMNAKVTKLYDIDNTEIPADMLKISVDEKEIDARVNALSLRYAKEADAQTAETGDIVFCSADEKSYPDKREIILFTGTGLQGAEKAEKDAVGKSVGDVFKTVICDEEAELTVKKIVRRIPAQIDDKLISSLSIDGVDTVEKYKAYIKSAALDNAKTEAVKSISGFLYSSLTENSEYSFDETEFEKEVEKNIELYKSDCEAYGMPYDPDEARLAATDRIKQTFAVRAFCQSKGISVDPSGAEEEADRMIEMASLTGEQLPERDELIEMMLDNEYIGKFFEYAESLIEEKIGG